eukprot:4863638-Prymnesium_polylepis.1
MVDVATNIARNARNCKTSPQICADAHKRQASTQRMKRNALSLSPSIQLHPTFKQNIQALPQSLRNGYGHNCRVFEHILRQRSLF